MSTMALDMENGGAEVQIDADGVKLDEHGLPAEVPGEESPILAADDPDRFNAVTQAVLQLEDEDFSISGPPDGRVNLIAGYIADGRRITDAEVKELNGADEEAIAKALATKDLARYIDTIVRVGTVRLGEIENPKELSKALDTLLIGDRDLLVMQIRRNTFGDVMRLDVVCPWCDAAFQVDYSFSEDVPMRGLNVPGAHDPAQRLFDVPLSRDRMASIRLVDGAAQKAVYTPENIEKTPEELNTIMLTELLESIDNKPVRGPGPVLEMKARDRRTLIEFITDTQPGPQYLDVKQECDACAREFPLPITVRDMFRGD